MLRSVLPPPKNNTEVDVEDVDDDEADGASAAAAAAAAATARPKVVVPPRGERLRLGWVPRTVSDYGDGGAFPEIHVAQYPRDMGRKRNASNALVLSSSVGEAGENRFDAIARYGHRQDKTVFTQHKDLVPVAHSLTDDDLRRPDPEEEAEVAERTRKALSGIVDAALMAKTNAGVVAGTARAAPQYVRYTPAGAAAANAGAGAGEGAGAGTGAGAGGQQRIIRMVEATSDPLEPPKFRAQKMPQAPPSPPVPVMHSPPRKVTNEDQANWRIPPVVSRWKNPKGYTIPLDKRMANDGRAMSDLTINDGHAKLSEALIIAERQAREEIEQRNKVRTKVLELEKKGKEQELRELAARVRQERVEAAAAGGARGAKHDDDEGGEEEGLAEREEIREERRKERERDYRMENAGKRTKMQRDRERDMSEQIALGQVYKGSAAAEVGYDQRLFNQSAGIGHGMMDDAADRVYSEPLFKSTSDRIYRPGRDNPDMFASDSVDEVLKQRRFQPDKGFSGAEAASSSAAASSRAGPVQFEKTETEDPFGLGDLLQSRK